MGINERNFTGKRGGKKIRRGGKGLKKEVKPHVSKYAHLAPPRPQHIVKSFMLTGGVGQVFPRGARIVRKDEIYELVEAVTVPECGKALGRFRFIGKK